MRENQCNIIQDPGGPLWYTNKNQKEVKSNGTIAEYTVRR